MGKKDFDAFTKSQMQRDSRVIREIEERYVRPLQAEIEAVIPGYRDMSERNKFVELMRLNQPHAPKGDWLMVHFGHTSPDDGYYKMESAVYLGGDHRVTCFTVDGVKCYHPIFIMNQQPGVTVRPGNRLYNNAQMFIEEETEDYLAFPIPFKIALIAQLIRQNLPVDLCSACRFVAGFESELTMRRWRINEAIGGNWQIFGWNIEIRDTIPENELLTHIARHIRATAEERASNFIGWPSDEGEITLFSEYDPRKRKPRESTELLVDFIERDLPSNGYYVGRSGEGTKLTWEQAYIRFNDLHPDIYSSRKSFEDSYHNAKQARKGR